MDEPLTTPEAQVAAPDPAPHERYDVEALGVECAWPAADREALMAR